MTTKSYYGMPFIEVRPPTCRRSWCGATAARDDGLCVDHGAEMDRQRFEAHEAERRVNGQHWRHLGSKATGGLR